MTRNRKDKNGKKVFGFVVEATISMNIDVDADTLEEAIELAQSAGILGLCHQCSGGDAGEWKTSGEFDTDCASSPLVGVYVDNEDIGDEKLAEIKAKWDGQ